jgi:lipoprotein-anchoring transpeptidase ErfK/SrfK
MAGWTGRRRPGRLARLGLVAIVAAVAVAGCSPGAQWQEPGDGDSTPTPTIEVMSLVYSHQQGEAGVSPGKPVTVQAFDGTLETVSLTSNVGEVPGIINEDESMWRSTQDLEFGKTYTLEVSGIGSDGKAIEETRTFSTVDVPVGYYWNVYFKTSGMYYGVALDGGTFGVGQPIVATFDDAVDRTVAERALSVQTTPAVQGSWYWVSDREAHWRPQSYWQPGTSVTVSATILGVSLTSPAGGRELHGQENKTATFTIGQSKIAEIDNNTKQMLVSIDGQQVNAIPVSMGKETPYTSPINGKTYDYRTPSGVMVVTEQQDPVLMKPDLPCPEGRPGTPGCDPGFYLETIPLASRITDSGIYVHAASWSVNDQGVRNVSHGCINVSPEDAQWFYDNFGLGDVVQVANTGADLLWGDGLGDWNIPWDVWTAGSAA